MDGLTNIVAFSLDGMRFALPLASVERVIQAVAVTSLPRAPAGMLGIINVQGRIVCVLDFRGRCGLPWKETELDDWFVLVRTPWRTVALPVESAQVIECDPRKLVSAAEAFSGSGAVRQVLKDPNGLILVQSSDALLSVDEERSISDAIAAGVDGSGSRS